MGFVTDELSRSLLMTTLAAAALLMACAGTASQDHLRGRLEGFFEATLNGDVAALDDYVSDACDQKAEFLKSAEALRMLEEVDVTLPEGAMLFDLDEEGDFAVAYRARQGPALLVNGEPFDDDPSNDVPLQLVREEGAWRVVNCGDYVAD